MVDPLLPIPTRSPPHSSSLAVYSSSPTAFMSKRASSSKPKGAVRAKSGCYTCRIRRKKCDEQQDNEGSCQTCVRLRLQCLGFGPKRPDWMREGNSVTELRGKIKGFLAQNGMIKGHSATSATGLRSSPPSALPHPSAATPGSSMHIDNSPPISNTSTLSPTGLGVSHPIPHSPGPLSPHMTSPTRPPRDFQHPANSGVLVLAEGRQLPSTRPFAPAPSGMQGSNVHSHGHNNRPSLTRSPVGSYATGGSANGGMSRNGGAYDQVNVDARTGGYSLGLGLDIGQLDEQQHHLGSISDTMNTHSSTRRSPSPYSLPHRTVDLLGSALPASAFSYQLASSAALPSAHTPAYNHLHTYSTPSASQSDSLSSNSASLSPYSSSSASPSLPPVLVLPTPPYQPTLLPDVRSVIDADRTSDVDAELLSPRSDALHLRLDSDLPHALDRRFPANETTPPWGLRTGFGVAANDIGVASGLGLHPNPPRVDIAGVDIEYDHDYSYRVPTRERGGTHLAFARARLYDDGVDGNCAPFDYATPSNSISAPVFGTFPPSVGSHHPHSPHTLAPTLSPDSPTPSRANGVLGPEVMLGYSNSHAANLHPHSHSLAHPGHSTRNGHAQGSAAPHQVGNSAYSTYSMQGYGTGHGGHPHTSSSYNHIRSNKPGLTSDSQYSQAPSHLSQGQNQARKSQSLTDYRSREQQEQEQEHGQTSYSNPYGNNSYPMLYQYNHTNESGALSFPCPSPTVPVHRLPPTLQSTFSRLYYDDPTQDDADIVNLEAEQSISLNTFEDVTMATNNVADGGAVIPYGAENYNTAYGFSQPEHSQYQQNQLMSMLQFPLMDPDYADRGDGALVKHYVRYVRPVQYFFADKRVDDLLIQLAHTNSAVRDAICFVSSVHRRRMSERPSPHGSTLQLPQSFSGPPIADESGEAYHDRARAMLKRRKEVGGDALTKAEAMASLQCVSSYLFTGGIGEWDWFLKIACDWVAIVLARTRQTGTGTDTRAALERLAREDELGGFIVRLTMWFEVLASVTQVRKPLFLDVYREVFSTTSARVVEVDGERANMESEFSMLQVMGCDNATFLALAEISALAAWKEEQMKNDMLSSPELVRRGSDIEERYLRTMYTESPPRSAAPFGADPDSLDNRRRLTANIFRASARLYLHTVLSGDRPGVKEIADGVRDTVDALRKVPTEPASLRRSVVRSVVFPICLAGCMAEDLGHREMLRQVLEGEGGVGNCAEVVRVMEIVWARRREARRGGPGGGVGWRDILRENKLPLLLV
ncbi:hypothetical protein M0805_007868 [Coniferiporia weirii]|nr:hypothetical protein M0805_007868 [Coniferiporia weirii]